MEQIVNSFREWIKLLNYSQSTADKKPVLISEFTSWLMSKHVQEPQHITGDHVKEWFAALSNRKLSLASLRDHRNALVMFSRYLQETRHEGFAIPVSIKGKSLSIKPILTLKEIESLYKATEEYPDPGIKDNGLLALRERVLLGVFYGCGVRLNEGVHLETEDILLPRSLLYVRKGKGYKERYVPITAKVKRDIEDYLTYSRPVLLRKRKHNALFTGWYGSPMKKQALYDRIQVLKDIARIDKAVGPHTLRHSIATHLLQSGMKLEQIARFLGHSSLESTQIYTHIKNEAC